MMSSRVRALLLSILIVAGAAGCATARLEVESAIYTGEPLLGARLRERDLLRLQVSVDAAEAEARRLKEARAQLSTKLVDAYLAYQCVIYTAAGSGFGCDRKNYAEILKDEKDYQARLDREVRALSTAAAEVRSAVADYTRITATDRQTEPAASDVIAARDRILAAARGVDTRMLALGPVGLGTNFEKDMRKILQGAPAALSAESLAALSNPKAAAAAANEAQALAKSLEALGSELKKQEADGLRIATNLSNELLRASKSMQSGSGFSGSVAASAAALSQVNVDMSPDAGKLAISNLAETLDFYNSQVDRLQDPADPVWREVTNPKNADKWNSVYARTVFYSEGKTGVVVLRDRAGQFRVHQAKNNPTALIQGQLRVSRAVTSGLTDVLGALTGASGLTGVLPGGKADPKSDSGASAVESIAEGDAKVRAEAERRRNMRANLLRNLERVSAELNGLPAGDPKIATLTTQINAILSGHKPLLEAKGE